MLKGRKYRVFNQQEYEALKERVESGAKFLEGKWLSPSYKRETAHFEEMAMSLYDWEFSHGLLDEEF